MVLSNAERQARYKQRLKERAELTPETARRLVDEMLVAWDVIQPEDEPWRAYVAGQKTAADALQKLDELANPSLAEDEAQRAALMRVRLLLNALALR